MFVSLQVTQLVREVRELRLRVDTMSKTIKTAELDSRASRYAFFICHVFNIVCICFVVFPLGCCCLLLSVIITTSPLCHGSSPLCATIPSPHSISSQRDNLEAGG